MKEKCNTCNDTGRWLSTTEDSPDELVYIGVCMDCDKKPFPREIVIHPSYGAGLATWWAADIGFERAYDIIESEVFRNAFLKKFTKSQVIDALLKANLIVSEDEIYLGGWVLDEMSLFAVTEPYYVEEYDGFESVVLKNDVRWRM